MERFGNLYEEECGYELEGDDEGGVGQVVQDQFVNEDERAAAEGVGEDGDDDGCLGREGEVASHCSVLAGLYWTLAKPIHVHGDGA